MAFFQLPADGVGKKLDASTYVTADGTVYAQKLVICDASGNIVGVTANRLQVDGSGVTQPVSGSVSVSNLPATQPVSLATNTPDITDRSGRLVGHVTVDSAPTTAVTGPLTDTQLRATAVPVSGTFFQATQPVSLATNTPDVTDRSARLLGHVTVDSAPTTAVTGTFFQATQPVSMATQTPDVTDRAARLLGHVTVDAAPTTAVTGPLTDTQLRASSVPVTAAQATPANLQATVTQLALTKGTQGATGVSTQDLKDAGRARVTIGFQAVAPATADTLLSLVKTSAGVAAGGATSIAVAANKTLRITAITFSLKANAAAAAFGTLTLRSNPAGATLIGSQSELRLDVGNTEALAGAAREVSVAIPDGMEFKGTETIGVSLAAQATTNIVSIALTGFEY